MSSLLLALEGMVLLCLVQHDKTVFGRAVSPLMQRLFKLLGSVFLLMAMSWWIARDQTSMGIAHAIMLFGLVALMPVFMLSFRQHWLTLTAISLPLVGIAIELFYLFNKGVF